MNSGPPSKDGLAQTQTALVAAEAHVAKALQLYEAKKAAAKGVPLEELKKLGPRGEVAKTRLAQLRASLKESGERVTAEGYLEEAAQKVSAVMDALGKLEDVDSKFDEGDNTSLEETLGAVEQTDAASATAQTASS